MWILNTYIEPMAKNIAFKQKDFYDCLLPGTLYFSVAVIPTLWNLYSIFL